MKKKENKLMIFIVCILLSIFGIYKTYFGDRKAEAEWNTAAVEKTREKEDLVTEQGENEMVTLPKSNNKSENAIYTEALPVEVYFSNADVIDEGNLPLEAHKILAVSTQKYLNRLGYDDVTELYVDETSYVEEEEKIYFNCFMDGHKEQLRIVYNKEYSELEFAILEE